MIIVFRSAPVHSGRLHKATLTTNFAQHDLLTKLNPNSIGSRSYFRIKERLFLKGAPSLYFPSHCRGCDKAIEFIFGIKLL